MFLDKFRDLGGVTVGVVVNEHPHHILRAEFVLGGEFAVMARGIDEQHLSRAVLGGRFFFRMTRQAGTPAP